MEINVKMSADEFIEFMKWKNGKGEDEREAERMGKWLEKLADKVLDTIEACDASDEPEYRLKSRDAAERLVAEAAKVFA